jgi:tetratricopeptide (TPR) repeat protein
MPAVYGCVEDAFLKKPHRRGPAPSAPIGALAERAAEAMRQARFKEAIELLKLMIRQDPRPDWKMSLADAYRGRARDLAAKKMFKEAAMVLENTVAADGTVRDPRLYLSCLIRDGQQPKAAAYLMRMGDDVPSPDRAGLEDLAAALLVAVPQLPDAAQGTPSRWHELATASRSALAAWVSGAPAAGIDQLINRISLRSAFRPVRLLLKSLTTQLPDEARTRQVLETIPQGSPFHPLRQAVETAVLQERGLDADAWERLSPAQQAFVAETRGLPEAASQALAHLSEAARGGPSILFGYLMKQTDLPRTELRSACLNLLPHIPDRLPQFEKTFGALPDLERHRIMALAAEARGDWEAVERSWRAATVVLGRDTDRQAMLSQGVIFRHLAHLAIVHPEIEGDDYGDGAIFYLERCCKVDPDHIPTLLELIGRYRKESRQQDWHRVVDEAIRRFPDDSQVLLVATEAAVERKAYKRAAGFARRLLKINPIHHGVRRQMIELQVAHARKQMRAKRPDLAAKELAAAAEWERSDSPSAVLHIARGLVELRTGTPEQGEVWLRQGVELAGGGVAGWFRAQLEAELMKATGADGGLLHQELVRAREAAPTQPAVMAIVSALGQPEAGENKRTVMSLLMGMRPWLLKAAGFAWSEAEFQALAEGFTRFEAFDLLQDYVRAARKRDTANPTLRFYDIVARTRGNSDRLSPAEMDELWEMADAAARREDFHPASRIQQFLDGGNRAPARKRKGLDDLANLIEDEEMAEELFAAMMEQMPKKVTTGLRELVGEIGRDQTVAQMIEMLRTSPDAPEMPTPMLRQLSEAIVAKALEGSQSGRGRAARGRPYF